MVKNQMKKMQIKLTKIVKIRFHLMMFHSNKEVLLNLWENKIFFNKIDKTPEFILSFRIYNIIFLLL